MFTTYLPLIIAEAVFSVCFPLDLFRLIDVSAESKKKINMLNERSKNQIRNGWVQIQKEKMAGKGEGERPRPTVGKKDRLTGLKGFHRATDQTQPIRGRTLEMSEGVSPQYSARSARGANLPMSPCSCGGTVGK